MPITRERNNIPGTKKPRFDSIPVRIRGPKSLRLWVTPDRVVGPGEPPAAFLTATTSRSEWPPYWALAKIFNDPADPRQAPYWGGKNWGYQVGLDGGRQQKGGAVIDYIVWLPGETIGIRLVTERFHVAAGPEKTAMDREQARSLERFISVRDLYEQDIIADTTGEAAIRKLIELLGGRERVDPAIAGTFRRVRPNTI